MTSLVPSGFVARLRYRFFSRPLTVSLREFHPINIHASSSTVHHPAWRLSWLALHTDGFRVRDRSNPLIFTRLFPFCSLEVKSYRFLLHEEGNYLLNIRLIGQHIKSNLQVIDMWYDMIYLLTAIGLPPGGSSTVHIDTQTIHRTTQNKQYIEQHKNFGRVWAVPRLCGLYPGICLTTDEKARKNLSQGSRRVPAGTMKIHKHTIKWYTFIIWSWYTYIVWCHQLQLFYAEMYLIKNGIIVFQWRIAISFSFEVKS
jgi:hypothetical protein